MLVSIAKNVSYATKHIRSHKLGVNNSCSYEKIELCNKAPQNLYNNYYFIKAVYNTEDL